MVLLSERDSIIGEKELRVLRIGVERISDALPYVETW